MRRAAILIALSAVFGTAACAASQRAAAKDPQRCERDPECAAKQGKNRDCATACADNIDCMKRCESVQRGTQP